MRGLPRGRLLSPSLAEVVQISTPLRGHVPAAAATLRRPQECPARLSPGQTPMREHGDFLVGDWRGMRAWRALGMLLLALQAVLWIGGPLVEGRADARANTAIAHVEASGSTGCAPSHHSHDCQIGRTLGAGAITAQGTRAVPPPVALAGAPSGVGARSTADASFGALGSRAPPL